MNRFTAVVAFMNEDTGDGRVVTDLWFRDSALSVARTATGDVIASVIGYGSPRAVEISGEELVIVVGDVDLEPGVYRIGMDLDQTQVDETHDEALCMAGRLMGLTVLTDERATSSWNCHMVVRQAQS